MSISEDLDLDPPRRKLLEDKLGDLLTWSVPEIFESIGPFEPERLEKYDSIRRELIANSIEALKHYSDAEIAMISDVTRLDPARIRDAWFSLDNDRITRFRTNPIPWYLGGFGHPDYQADFEYWSKMPHFSVEEILCLSVGIEPEHFQASFLRDLQEESPSDLWPAVAFLVRRWEQLKRQFDPRSSNWKVSPRAFLDWVDQVDLDVAPEFRDRLRACLGSNPETSSTEPTPKKQDKREVDSIAQLFSAMAIEYFGYVPSDPKSTATKEIADLAASMGMSISDDTVRKYLKLGASHIPPDWEPHNR